MNLRKVSLLWIYGVCALSGCGQKVQKPKTPSTYSYNYNYGQVDPSQIAFNDEAKANAKESAENLQLSFTDTKGQTVEIAQFKGKKHVVLVFTRGYAGSLCPFCSAQTSRLLANYAEFSKRDTEVLVVFPGPTEQLDEFVKRVKQEASGKELAFPMLLDKEFKAVEKLGIRSDLAKPSTYIVDKSGQVRFAYVGATTVDRPSVKALLNQLDDLEKKPS